MLGCIAEAFVLDPEKSQDQPTPQQFLDGAPVYGKSDSTLTIRSTSGASLIVDKNTVKLDQAPITFTRDGGTPREGYAIGSYTGASDLIFILRLS